MEKNNLLSDVFLLFQQKQNNSKARQGIQGLKIYSIINSILNIISNRKELDMYHSDFMNSQMFYNLCKSSHVDRY